MSIAYRSIVPPRWRHKINRVRYNGRGRSRTLQYVLGDAQFRDKRTRLAELADKYKGERCVIMGNGPSLNKMNLSVFDNEFVWASNRAYLLFDRISWRPSFWVSVDRRVVPDIADELLELQLSLSEAMFFFPDVFLLTGILESRPNTWWFYERRDEQNFPYGVFSLDVPSYVASAHTVTITSIQLAVHLGFNPIYLIGCDTEYLVPPSSISERGNPEHLLSQANDDPNHFDPRYFGTGRRWHQPHPDLMLKHYAQVRQVTDTIGVSVYNATVGGALEAFDRVDYSQLT